MDNNLKMGPKADEKFDKCDLELVGPRDSLLPRSLRSLILRTAVSLNLWSRVPRKLLVVKDIVVCKTIVLT